MLNKLEGILKKECVGKRNALTREQLAWRLGRINDRELRDMIRELRLLGVPVLYVSESPGGYFIPKYRREADETIAKETHRAQRTFQSVAGIIRGINKRFPGKKQQLKFTME